MPTTSAPTIITASHGIPDRRLRRFALGRLPVGLAPTAPEGSSASGPLTTAWDGSSSTSDARTSAISASTNDVPTASTGLGVPSVGHDNAPPNGRVGNGGGDPPRESGSAISASTTSGGSGGGRGTVNVAPQSLLGHSIGLPAELASRWYEVPHWGHSASIRRPSGSPTGRARSSLRPGSIARRASITSRGPGRSPGMIDIIAWISRSKPSETSGRSILTLGRGASAWSRSTSSTSPARNGG